MGKQWRRWLTAVLASLAAHAALFLAFLAHKPVAHMDTPAVTVELIAEAPRPDRPKPKPARPERPPPPVQADAPRLVAVAPPASVVAPIIPVAPARPQALPPPLYAGRAPQPQRSCWDGRLSEAEKARCARMGLAEEDRFAVGGDKAVPGSVIDPDKIAAFTAPPTRPPVHFQGKAEYCSSNGCVISDDAVVIGFTLKKKF